MQLRIFWILIIFFFDTMFGLIILFFRVCFEAIIKTYFILSMKKRQAEQYFGQLKKIDRERNIKLADLINILTGGTVSLKEYESFIEELKSNEFGQFSYIDQNIDKQDWRLLEFSQIYELLKAIKSFIAKRVIQRKKDVSELAAVSKERLMETSSGLESKTVMELLNRLTQVEDPQLRKMDQERQQQKCKKGKIKILKKLLIIFDYYRKAMWVKDQTFDKNQQMIQHLNITMFMRYSKEFNLSSTFELSTIIKCYKKHAINTIWIDFDRFVSIHYELMEYHEKMKCQERYGKLKILSDFLASEKMKKILNNHKEMVTSNVVVGHTGVCKEDVLKHLQEKSKERLERIEQKWSLKSASQKELGRRRNLTEPKEQQSPSPVKKLNGLKKSQRVKTETAHSVYDQLRLPKLRLKEHRIQSVYKCLKDVNVGEQQQKLKTMLDLSENEEFLNEYLKEEDRLKQRAKSKLRKILDLPRMKFT